MDHFDTLGGTRPALLYRMNQLKIQIALICCLLISISACDSQIEAMKSGSYLAPSDTLAQPDPPDEVTPTNPDNPDDPSEDVVGGDGGTGDTGSQAPNFIEPFTPLRKLTVCSSGCDHSTVSAAVAVSREYDLIEVHGGTYVDCAAINTNNLWLKGVNGRPHLKDKVCQSKGIFVTNGRNIIIENFELSGMAISESLGNNAAGIRGQGQELHVRNVYFHDGQNGILGGARAGDGMITVANSHFARLGYDGYEHLIYIDKVKNLVVKNSVFEQGVKGNMIKSRALASEISCNQIIGGISAQYPKDGYAINLPNGGAHKIEGNIVVQGAYSNQRTLIDFGSEGLHAGAPHSLLVRENHMINEMAAGTFLQMFEAASAGGVMSLNRITGVGTIVGGAGASSIQQTNNTRLSSGALADATRPSFCDRLGLLGQ